MEQCWFGLALADEGLRCPNPGEWINLSLLPPMDRSVWCSEHKHDSDERVRRNDEARREGRSEHR